MNPEFRQRLVRRLDILFFIGLLTTSGLAAILFWTQFYDVEGSETTTLPPPSPTAAALHTGTASQTAIAFPTLTDTANPTYTLTQRPSSTPSATITATAWPAPEVSPLSLARVYAGEPVIIRGTAQPGDTIHVYDQGMLVGSTTADQDGVWTVELSGGLSAGEHILAVEAVSPGGAASQSVPVGFEVNRAPTATPLPSATATHTPTDTPVPTNTALPTRTPVPTATETSVTPTRVALAAPTSTPLPSAMPAHTPTDTPVPTNTALPTHTTAPTSTPLPSATPTHTPTNTAVPTNTPLPTQTTAPTATETSVTPTRVALAAPTTTPSPSATPTHTPTAAPFPTSTAFPTRTAAPAETPLTPSALTALATPTHAAVAQVVTATPTGRGLSAPIIESLPPTVSLFDPLTIRGSAEPQMTVQLSLGGGGIGTADVDQYGSWALIWQPDVVGTVTFTAVTIDPASGAISPPATASTRITAPRPHIDEPMTGTVYSPGMAILVRGTAPAGLTVEVYNSGTGTSLASAVTAGDGTWETTITLYGEGSVTLAAVAQGPGGVELVSNQVTITLAPPVPPKTGAGDGANPDDTGRTFTALLALLLSAGGFSAYFAGRLLYLLAHERRTLH